jgi:hypothetical protein
MYVLLIIFKQSVKIKRIRLMLLEESICSPQTYFIILQKAKERLEIMRHSFKSMKSNMRTRKLHISSNTKRST